MRDDEVVMFAAPKAIKSGAKLDFPSLRRAGIDEQSVCHGRLLS
jgi:hypothetical protein